MCSPRFITGFWILLCAASRVADTAATCCDALNVVTEEAVVFVAVNACELAKDCLGDGLTGICLDCLLGNYCPPGTVNRYGLAVSTLCPDGQYCSPDLRRISYNNGQLTYYYEYAKDSCPPGRICPAGTVNIDNNVTSCQSHVLDVMETMLPDALPSHTPSGYYCAEGTSGFEQLVSEPVRRLQQCEGGSYCPTTEAQLLCTPGHYCKKMVSGPWECPGDGVCKSEGSDEPDLVYTRLIAFSVVVCMFSIGVFVSNYYFLYRTQQAAMELQSANAETNKRFQFLKKMLQGIDISDFGGAPKGFHICPCPTSILFEDLVLAVGKLTLLDHVSGLFAHSRMTAIMGPSGCGKSSLLNTLCGKATYGTQSGRITINGVECPVSSLKTAMGFVPQDDTIFGDLTVLENLVFSAKLRLPPNFNLERQKNIVQGVVNALQLENIQNSVVGTVEARGISGGQKKRVNIGLEMVTDPTMLFLDEPTSGLGAADTLLVTTVLNSLTRTKRSVVAVVHQPRYQVASRASQQNGEVILVQCCAVGGCGEYRGVRRSTAAFGGVPRRSAEYRGVRRSTAAFGGEYW
eukprot:gene10873-12869_t